MPTPLALIVDDNPALRKLLALLMANFSYTIDEFSEPSSALAAFARAPNDYEIVITDFSMTGMTGLELVSHIRRIRPAIPTIVTSGVLRADNRDLVQPRLTFLPKPFTPDMLAKAVETVRMV